MISVVIPAHNEEGVVARCLNALAEGSQSGEIQVTVVCNGCTDKTADLVRQRGAGVRVLETPSASKVNALNLGDHAASGFPRFYIDADILIDTASIRAIARRLEEGDVLAASPDVRYKLAGASWAVRAFYAVDQCLPSAQQTIGGSGVYALSAEGRKRFGAFPNVTADDAFVRRRFSPHERCRVDGAWSIVTPPKTLAGVIAIKTRSHYGNYELDQLYPELRGNMGPSNRAALVKLALRPWLWPKLAVYGYVKVVARLRARARIRRGDRRWERDDTSRQPITVGSRSGPSTVVDLAPPPR